MNKLGLLISLMIVALLFGACGGGTPVPAPANPSTEAVEPVEPRMAQPNAAPAGKLATRLGAQALDSVNVDAASASAEVSLRDATKAETAQAFEIMKAQPDVLIGDPVKKMEILVNGNAFPFGEENETFLGTTDLIDRTYVMGLAPDGASLNVYTVGHDGTVAVVTVSGHFKGLVHASVSLNGKWILLLSQKDPTTAGTTAQLITIDGGAGPAVQGTFAWTGTAWLDATHVALRVPNEPQTVYQALNPNRPEIGLAEDKAHWVVLGF